MPTAPSSAFYVDKEVQGGMARTGERGLRIDHEGEQDVWRCAGGRHGLF